MKAGIEEAELRREARWEDCKLRRQQRLHSAPSSTQASMFTCSNCSRPCVSRIGLYGHGRYIETLSQTNLRCNYHSLLGLMDANNNNLTFSYYFIFDIIVCVLVTFYQCGHFDASHEEFESSLAFNPGHISYCRRSKTINIR